MDFERNNKLDTQIISLIKTYTFCFTLVTPSEASNLEKKQKEFLHILQNPEYEGIKKLISVIKAYELLYDTGVFSSSEHYEIGEFVAYLLSLIPQRVEKKTIRKRNINTLGVSFLKNSFGVPLFGLFHPERIPPIGGILLGWTSKGEDDSILISATELTEDIQINYEGLGVNLETQNRWMLMLLSKKHEAPSIFTKDSWLSGADHYSYSQYKLSISGQAVICPAMSAIHDPLENSYLYYFFSDSSLRFKMLRYISRTLVGRFGIALRESETKAQEFIQRLL